MLLQAIVIDDRAYEVEKASRSFIKRADLPLGLPAVGGGDLALRGARDATCGCSTSRTSPRTIPRRCAAGGRTSCGCAARAGELGYDLRFRRLWELYLAYSEGGFIERRIGDVQALLAGPAYRGPARPPAGRS